MSNASSLDCFKAALGDVFLSSPSAPEERNYQMNFRAN